MIEVVYEKEKQKPVGNENFFRIPNNIRQIGEVGDTDKIYIEDYAYTYLSRISSENISRGVAAVLLGKSNWNAGVSYLFIKSAVVISDMEVGEEHLVFSEEIWNQIYEQSKEYFRGQDIVGWFLSIPGCSMDLHEVICKTHMNHFGGSDKVLLVMEPTEKEEAFYRYERGKMNRQDGYYIYYEKNESMQDYLIRLNGNESIEKDLVEDKAVKNFRRIIENKKEEKKRRQTGSLVYAMACGIMAVIIVSGVVLINDYDKMKALGEDAAQIELAKQQEHQVADETISEIAVVTADATEEEDALTENTESTVTEDDVEESSVADEDATEDSVEESAEVPVEETSAEPAIHSYVVQKGDTITAICRLYYGNISKIDEVCRYNGLTVDEIIYPGQIILLP